MNQLAIYHPKGPWNKNKLVGQKLPLKLQQIWAIRIRLELSKKVRDLALFNLAIDSKLRGCDLVSLKVSDIAHSKTIQSRLSSSEYLFQSRIHSSEHISTRQYGRIVDNWVASIGLDITQYSTHSMRRTKPSLIYKKRRI
jgi:integrase